MTSTIDANPTTIDLEDWTSTGPVADLSELRPNSPGILLCWSAAGTNVLSARTLGVGRLFADNGSTAAGRVISDPIPNFQQAVGEIRRRSGLTWEQLARVFGVGRRSVHFWARGARPSAENAERIGRVLRIVRELDTGSPDRTRAALLDASSHGRSIFELLCDGRDPEAALMSRGVEIAGRPERSDPRARRNRRPPPLSATERRRRQVANLDDLLGGFDAEAEGLPAIGGSLGGGVVTGLRI